MTIEQNETPLGGYPAMLHDENVAFSDALRKFVRKVGTLPPNHVYDLHPAFDPLVDLLVARRASWEGAWLDEARAIIRSFIQTDQGYICLGGIREDHLREREEFIAEWRKYPHGRPSKWRENARLRTLVAELVSPEEPTDPETAHVWRLLGYANYVPHIAQLTRKAGWKA